MTQQTPKSQFVDELFEKLTDMENLVEEWNDTSFDYVAELLQQLRDELSSLQDDE